MVRHSKYFAYIFLLTFGLFAISPQSTYAQTRPTPNISCVDEGTGEVNPDVVYVSLVNRCVNVDEFSSFLLTGMVIVGVLAAIYRLSAGFFMIVTAEGEPTKLQNGREALTEAIVGVTVVVGAYALIQLIGNSLPETWLINLS